MMNLFGYVQSYRACGPASKRTYDALKLRPLSGKQYLTAFGHESEAVGRYMHMAMHGAMRYMHGAMPKMRLSCRCKQSRRSSPRFHLPMPTTIAMNDDDDNDGKDDKSNRSCDKIFRDKTQHTSIEAKNDKRYILIEEQGRSLAKITELLSTYTTSKQRSHRFDDKFPTLVNDFVREHPERFTPELPGTVPLLLTALGYKPYNLCRVLRLDLSRFQGLSGDTVVKLVQAVAAGNRSFMARKQKQKRERALAAAGAAETSLSTTGSRPATWLASWPSYRWMTSHLGHPGLAAVSDGRIAKLTSRTRFLEPLERLAARQVA